MAVAQKNLFIGICAGIGAGLLWGLVFLAPQPLYNFTPFEIAFGRFFFFAAISLFSVRNVISFAKKLPVSELAWLAALSACGFWLYTILVAWSVQHSGGIMTTLIIGLLPITIALIGSRFSNISKTFVVGLFLLAGGLLTLTIVPVINDTAAHKAPTLIGVMILVAALAMWTWYALASAAFVKKYPEVAKGDLISFFGILSFLCLCAVAPFAIEPSHLIHHSQLMRFIIFAAILGTACTWLAYWLWSVCAAHCPPSILGPLIVVETVSGLIYTFMYEARLPLWHEVATIVLFVMGAMLCIRSEIKAEPVAV